MTSNVQKQACVILVSVVSVAVSMLRFSAGRFSFKYFSW